MKHYSLYLLAILVLLGTPTTGFAEQTKKPTVWPDCYCVNRGGVRHELGEMVCLFVDGQSFLARCEMSLNNPSWKKISDICPVSRLDAPEPLPQSSSKIWPS